MENVVTIEKDRETEDILVIENDGRLCLNCGRTKPQDQDLCSVCLAQYGADRRQWPIVLKRLIPSTYQDANPPLARMCPVCGKSKAKGYPTCQFCRSDIKARYGRKYKDWPQGIKDVINAHRRAVAQQKHAKRAVEIGTMMRHERARIVRSRPYEETIAVKESPGAGAPKVWIYMPSKPYEDLCDNQSYQVANKLAIKKKKKTKNTFELRGNHYKLRADAAQHVPIDIKIRDALDAILNNTNDVPGVFDAREQTRNVSKAVTRAKLTGRQWQCIEMVYIYDMTQEQIAFEIGIQQPTVNQHLRSALKKIQGFA